MMTSLGQQTYTDPPLLEAVIAFQFHQGDLPWDSVYFGKIHKELEAEFPVVETLTGAEFQFAPEKRTQVRLSGEIKRFKRADGGMVLTVGPATLGVSVLPSKMPTGHPGWPSLFETAQNVLRIYESVVRPTRIQQIGVRYINVVTMPPSEFVLGDVISDRSGLIPERMLQERNPFSFRYEHLVGVSRGAIFREVLQLVAKPVPNEMAQFVLDIDEIWQPNSDEAPNVEEVGNRLHQSVYQLFEVLFREEVKERFGPVHNKREAQR